jgi:hypothetical protein
MANALPLGITTEIAAIPPIEENTRYVDCGVLSIGVEYRFLNNNLIAGSYEDTKDKDAVAERAPAGIDDEGLSFHVCDGESGTEYLRFDVFRDDPHYHYLRSDGTQQIVSYDTAAHGDMFDWATTCLRSRLPQMLEHAGAGDLAGRVDGRDVDQAMPAVLELAKAGLGANA